MVIAIVKLLAVLIAAIIIGNSFTGELRKTRAAGKPMYKAYLSLPGMVIILTVLGMPILLWWLEK